MSPERVTTVEDLDGIFETDPTRFSDPEYLAMIRCRASSLIRFAAEQKNRRFLKRIIEWVSTYSVEKSGTIESYLFSEEMELIREFKLEYPHCSEPASSPLFYKMVSNDCLYFDLVPVLLREGLKVGIVSGVFDIIHIGHVKFLYDSKRLCDVLCVGVDDDNLANARRYNGRPYNSWLRRAATIANLPFVGHVFEVPEIATTGVFEPKNYCTLFGFSRTPQQFIEPEYLDWRKRENIKNPAWVSWYEMASNLLLIWTAGDPAERYKIAGANYWGAKGVRMQRYTNLSSTSIGEHFGVKRNPSQTEFPGEKPYWMKSLTKGII